MDALKQLQQLRQSLPPATPENAELREDMRVEARKLMLDLERPDNAVERVCFGLMESSMVRIAVRMGLFKELNKSDASTVNDLATTCNADPILVGRVLRCLAAYGAVQDKGSDSYGPKTVSHTFASPVGEAAIEVCFDGLGRGWQVLPEFLEERKWRNTTSHTDTPMAKAFNKPEGASLWQVIKDLPMQKAFNIYMGSFHEGHRDWLEFYPAMDRLGTGALEDPASVLMVDVGGGAGHQALNFRHKFPQISGRVIVQDLPQGLPTTRSPDIEYMEHDFTQEQPIKGARLYYLRYVIHDYAQDFNAHLCTQLRKAMKPGYSRLIIHDFIVPAVAPSTFMTTMDFVVMCALGGMERTLALHTEFLEKAGLKVTKVYYPGDKISEGIIEAEVAE